MIEQVTVIGGGLAGVEAAWQVANAGIKVKLYEMKPHKYSPAHHMETLAELCTFGKQRTVKNYIELDFDRIKEIFESCY